MGQLIRQFEIIIQNQLDAKCFCPRFWRIVGDKYAMSDNFVDVIGDRSQVLHRSAFITATQGTPPPSYRRDHVD